jgi:hypothetical protein
MYREEYMDIMREESEVEDQAIYGDDGYNNFECITTEDEWDHVGPDEPYWLTHEEIL